jgi:hypothetical protein
VSFGESIVPFLARLRRPDGQLADAQCDASGSLRVTVAREELGAGTWIEPARGQPLGHVRVMPGGAGRRLRQLLAVNAGPELRWLQLFDLGGEPPANAEPILTWPLGARAAITLPLGRVFESSIVWAASRDPGRYSADPAALFWVSAEIAP